MEKAVVHRLIGAPEREALLGMEAILEVLARDADDHKFLARLAENPTRVLLVSSVKKEK